MAALIFLGVVILAAGFFVGMYNSLVQLRNRVKNAWSQIDVQLKRRHDLIPNLVETAKGYMSHERETLTAITEARAKAMGAGTVHDKGAAETQLSAAVSKFMLTVENYPDLKANQNFLSLQEELTTTENKIAFARQAYNDSVMSYNTYRESFPQNQIAGAFGFKEAEPFEIEVEAQREAPRVSF